MLDEESTTGVPSCPADDIRMVATVVGWRCPICGAPLIPRAA